MLHHGDLVTIQDHPEPMPVVNMFGADGIEIASGIGVLAVVIGPDSSGRFWSAEIASVQKVKIQ